MTSPLRDALRFPTLACLLMLVLGCPPGSDDKTDTDTAASAQEADTDTDTDADTDAPASNWCDAVRGGATGSRVLAHDFANAHIGQRLFGPTADWLNSDETLVTLLEDEDSLNMDLLVRYADEFDDVCTTVANARSSPEASVTLHGEVAVITPGTGSIDLTGATSVIVDLRTPASDEAIEDAFSAVLADTQLIAAREMRKFMGFPSQDDDWTHYEVRHVNLSVHAEGTADTSRPLVIFTGRTLTPAAATLVGGLRLNELAGLAGHDVYAAVAESHWTGIQDEGLAWRSSSLTTSGETWPDVIPADLQTNDLDAVLEAMDSLSAPATISGQATRSDMETYDRSAGMPAAMLTQGTMRAAFLVAYGTFDWFYAYFDLVGRDIDDALLTALEEVNGIADGDRGAMAHTMGRFMHDLYDGHGFYWDEASTDWPDGWMAIQIQEVDGLPVVRSSLTPDIYAGDTLVAVDGTPIEEWYEEAMSRYSASSDGYRFVLATDELTEVRGSPQWTLRDPDGVERTVTAQASDWDDVESVPWGGSERPSGWLEDLGAPDVYFVNMAGNITPDETEAEAELAAATSTAGVILDMRDYPYLDIYEFARAFNPAHFSAPLFGHPTWTGPGDFEIDIEAWTFNAGAHVVDEPVILLVSNKSVSAAECFAQMVMGLDNVTVIGQQSASTNGTITNAWLPGQWQITFTGMRLTNPDGSEFHGIGVVPDIEVTPDPSEFAAGIDPELAKALEVLGY